MRQDRLPLADPLAGEGDAVSLRDVHGKTGGWTGVEGVVGVAQGKAHRRAMVTPWQSAATQPYAVATVPSVP